LENYAKDLSSCQHNYRMVNFKECKNTNIHHWVVINTSYSTGSYIVFTLKMESVSKITIFGLKMMVKSGLEKIFLKFLHVEAIFF